MEQQQSTVCYIHVMHIAYIALFICTLVHYIVYWDFSGSVITISYFFWQVLGTCRWRIFRRPGIFWRTTTVQGSHLTLWDTQLFSSLQVYILILDFVIYMYMCLLLCVVFSFDDLRAGLAFMKRRASHRSEGPITFVKSNLSSTLDCLESLDGMSN